VNKVVWKWPLSAVNDIAMPIGAQVMCVQAQGLDVCLWALVKEGETSTEFRSFRVVGTGHPFKGDNIKAYIGTVQINDGSLVLHCFEMH
jgi:hypothetical protein